jgi:hypothetical protein
MTNIGDVLRQIEAVMNDIYYPPTSHESEVCSKILSMVCNGAVDPRGSE